MQLRSARVIGFQSFADSGVVEFADGINLIVGQNNAGKSALLRALLPELADDRHRTPERWEDFRLPVPVTDFQIEISGEELLSILLRPGSRVIPVPDEADPTSFVHDLVAQPGLIIAARSHPNRPFTTGYPGHGQFVQADGVHRFAARVTGNNGDLVISFEASHEDTFGSIITELWQNKMFYFSAERMNVGDAPQAYGARLLPNASNLPNVLQMLTGDRGALFDRLVAHLREIFPTVGNLSDRPRPETNYIEVRVWPTEERERVELSFPLNSSGTGVSQVIALLTAIMTIENAVIIVDEINSFLHPAAVKSLLRILQTEYSQHQYIISTHAPEVIGFSNPRTILLVKRSGYESSVAPLVLEEVDQFRAVAEHLGVSMADVFAAERVIWVEGPTEELCFPLLYTHATGEPLPRGTIFTSVVATGDFVAKKRDRELIYQIYRRLSSATTPLVQSVQFSFDSEELSDQEIEDTVRQSEGAVHFLPRRHIECFLINPEALADFVAARDLGADGPLEAGAVAARLAELAAENPFRIDAWVGDIASTAWQSRVDAAKLITRVCSDLSEGRVTFNKKDDTLTLLQLVMEIAPEQIAPLADYSRKLVRAAEVIDLKPYPTVANPI
jgi:predicted ATPase